MLEHQTYLALLDVDGRGNVEHIVLYRQRSGHLDRLVASLEVPPFDGVLAIAKWLHSTLALDVRPPGR